MSGLNDDVNAEFPEAAKEDGITRAGVVDIPNEQTAILDTTTVIPEDYSAGNSNQVDAAGDGVVAASGDNAEDPEVVMPTIANYDAWIKTEEDRVPQLHRLRDITETILAVESIGLETLQNIEHKAGAETLARIEQEVGPINTFTAVPTSTNLRETKNCLRRLLLEKEAEVADHYSWIRANRFAALRDLLTTCQAEAPAAISILEEIINDAKAALIILTNSKNTYFSLDEVVDGKAKTSVIRLTDERLEKLTEYSSVIPGFSQPLLKLAGDTLSAVLAAEKIMKRVHMDEMYLNFSSAVITDAINITYRELLQLLSASTVVDDTRLMLDRLTQEIDDLSDTTTDEELKKHRINLYTVNLIFTLLKTSPELELKAVINMFTKLL